MTLKASNCCRADGSWSGRHRPPGFAWLLHARRLNKDYEKNRRNSQSMVYLAMIAVMLNRLK
jgi:transposase